jgi:hypothetical protein
MPWRTDLKPQRFFLSQATTVEQRNQSIEVKMAGKRDEFSKELTQAAPAPPTPVPPAIVPFAPVPPAEPKGQDAKK